MKAIFEDIQHVLARAHKKELRKFGITVGAVFAVLGGVLFWKHSALAPYLSAVAALLIMIGLALPRLLRPLYIAWMSLAVVLGFFMSRLILTVLFGVVFVPAGMVMRLLHKDPLRQRFDSQAHSYWMPRKRKAYTPEQTEKQY